MANASAFGFSGYDPVGSSAEGFVNESFGKRSAETNFKYQIKAMEHQYDLMLKSLRESPSAQRDGLINAGYNPMLAISNGLSHPFSGSSSSSYMSTPDISSASNGFDAAGFAMAKEALKREKVKTENIKKEGKLLDAKTRETNVQTGTQVLDGVGDYIDLMDKGNTGGTKGGTKGGKTKINKNSSLKSSAKTPKISKGGSTFLDVLKKTSPALLWSAMSGITAGAGYLGHKAQKIIRKDRRSNYHKQRKGTVGNAFGIPSYHNH